MRILPHNHRAIRDALSQVPEHKYVPCYEINPRLSDNPYPSICITRRSIMRYAEEGGGLFKKCLETTCSICIQKNPQIK